MLQNTNSGKKNPKKKKEIFITEITVQVLPLSETVQKQSPSQCKIGFRKDIFKYRQDQTVAPSGTTDRVKMAKESSRFLQNPN